MKEAQPRHIVNSDLAFRHHFTFEPDFTSSALDYVDSNGDRHPEELAANDFSKADIPLLQRSSLWYYPADPNRDETDYFMAQVVCDNPTGIQGPNRLRHIRHLLTQRLQACVPNHTIRHLDGHVRIMNNSDPSLIADIHLQRLEGQKQLWFELIVPSPHDIDDAERYDDLCFTSELWVLLHDFCANLSVELNSSARQLGRIIFSPDSRDRLLQVGHETATDACRFGIELLAQASLIDRIDFADELNIREFDEVYEHLPDEVLRRIIRRALTLAHDERPDPLSKKKKLTQEHFTHAFNMERAFVVLKNELQKTARPSE